jgi:hypothetical protein
MPLKELEKSVEEKNVEEKNIEEILKNELVFQILRIPNVEELKKLIEEISLL